MVPYQGANIQSVSMRRDRLCMIRDEDGFETFQKVKPPFQGIPGYGRVVNPSSGCCRQR